MNGHFGGVEIVGRLCISSSISACVFLPMLMFSLQCRRLLFEGQRRFESFGSAVGLQPRAAHKRGGDSKGYTELESALVPRQTHRKDAGFGCGAWISGRRLRFLKGEVGNNGSQNTATGYDCDHC